MSSVSARDDVVSAECRADSSRDSFLSHVLMSYACDFVSVDQLYDAFLKAADETDHSVEFVRRLAVDRAVIH
jgi:hypothetical protein